MAFLCEKDEATAGRRFVPFRLFASNGTAPFTTGSNNTMLASLNGAAQISIGSVSVVSANAGMYGLQLTQSNVSTLGSLALYTDNVANYPQHVATVQVVNNNPMSTQSGVLLGNQEYSAVTVRLGLVAYSGATVGAGNFAPGVYSGVSFSIRDSGIAPTSFQAASYSGVSVEIKTGGIQPASMGAGNYSGVSVEVKTKGIAKNSIETVNVYSALTIDGLSNYANISNVTLAAGTHSNVTIQGISNYANISSVTLNIGVHSGATVQGVTRINSSVTPADALYSAVTVRLDIAQSFSGVTVDGARFLSPAGERSIASSIMSTNMGGTTARLFQQGWEVLRNRVQVSGSTMTVYKGDDATSSWTATISTGTATVYGVTPGIA